MRLVLPVPGVTKQNGWPKAKQQGVPYEPFSKRTRIWNLVSMQHTVAACKRDKSQHACSRPVFTPCLCCLPIYLAFLLRLLVQALFTLLNSPQSLITPVAGSTQAHVPCYARQANAVIAS